MTLLPANLALTNIAPNAAILSADHRTNYSAIQAYANALNAILGAGTSGQPLLSGGAGAAAYGSLPIAQLASYPADANKVLTGAGTWLGGMVLVADNTLSVAAASFDFTGLPTTYAHLMVVLYTRGDAAAISVAQILRLNNDSGANYQDQRLYGDGAGVTAAESLAGTSIGLGNTTASTGPANAFGTSIVMIPHYAGASNQKTISANVDYRNGTGAGSSFTMRVSGWWASTAAVNRVTIAPSSGNFVAGSRCSIYVMGS